MSKSEILTVVPIVVQQVKNTVSMRMRVQSLVSFSGLWIQHCSELGVGCRHSWDLALLGCGVGQQRHSDSAPTQELLYATGAAPKREKEKKEKNTDCISFAFPK